MATHVKRFVPDAAVKAANTCTQVLGGMGLPKPSGMDRLSRLSQMLRIVDGTTEISRSGLCLKSGGNSPAAFSEQVDLGLIRP